MPGSGIEPGQADGRIGRAREDGRGPMASETRQKMIVGTARLLAERGLQETSLTQVLELTDTPRGSIYHHFPNGKDELIAAAVDLAGSHAVQVIEQSEG